MGMLGGISQTMWPDHCVQGSTGAQIHKDLAFEKVSILRRALSPTTVFNGARLPFGERQVVQKGTAHHVDSYSGFFDNAHGHDTGLNTLLKDHNIVCSVLACRLRAARRLAIDSR